MAAKEAAILFLSLTVQTLLSCSCLFPRVRSGGCEAIHESVLLLGKNKKSTKTDRQNDSPCDPTTAGSDTGSGGLSRTDAFGTNPALEQVS